MRQVAVVRTGVANTASVFAGLRRLDARVEATTDPDVVRSAAFLVLPGVGAFAPAMAELSRLGLVEPLRERLRSGAPTLCVCLGMQLLCERSEESPGVPGLGLIPSGARRFGAAVPVPQLGWNRVEAPPGCAYLASGHAYFANSYRIVEPPAGWRVARADYDGPFCAALERDGILACQFHPELSGAFGRGLLERWLAQARVPC